MALLGLGYAGFGSDALDDWRQFGTGFVGLQAVERGNNLLAFRMDDRKQRIVIDRALGNGTRFFGWEVADAAALVVAGIEETLYYYVFPREHWRSLRTNNPLERLLREVRRRTRAVGAFPDGKSALMLAAARLRHVAGTKWGTRRYLDMNRLSEASEAA